MKLDKMRSSDKVIARQLKDPHVRAEWDRTAVARAVAARLVEYRVEHELSQTALARLLGMKQPAVARLEAGEHNPSFDTLARLSSALGIEFHIAVTPAGVADLTRAWIESTLPATPIRGRRSPDPVAVPGPAQSRQSVHARGSKQDRGCWPDNAPPTRRSGAPQAALIWDAQTGAL